MDTRRKFPKAFPPPQFTFSWCKKQRTLGKSTNQMAKAFGVSPRTMKRWLTGMGFSIGKPADLRLGQRRQAFSQALEYANGLEVYPHDEEIEGMAVHTFPFHREDLVEMIETRPFRGLERLTDKATVRRIK